jgi:hypothetical protein
MNPGGFHVCATVGFHHNQLTSMCRTLQGVFIFRRVEAHKLTKWSVALTFIGHWTGESHHQSASDANWYFVCSPFLVHEKHAWRIAISVCSYLCQIVLAQNSTLWKGSVFCMYRTVRVFGRAWTQEKNMHTLLVIMHPGGFHVCGTVGFHYNQ